MIRRVAAVSALVLALMASPTFARTGADAPNAAAALDILKHSIAIPTVEGRGKVPELARYYASVLKEAGYADSDILITPMGETATLEVTLKGASSARPVLLIGHMDVVEAKAEDWTRDPFVPVVENGYIFGRGSEDNKYDVAMMVATMARLKREGYRPRRDVILALSGDEETQMATTRALARKYRNAEMVLNGDGGGGVIGEDGQAQYYGLQAGEKSYADYEITLTSPGGHSSMPTGDNPIYRLATALAKIQAYEFPAQSNELTQAALTAAGRKLGGELGAAMLRYAADPKDLAAAALISRQPEYVGQVRTTCVATMASAGHAPNALPQRATANINCRIFPGVSIESVRETLTQIVGDGSATIKTLDDPLASDASPLRPDVVQAVTKAVHARYPGLPVVPSMSAGATDSLHFRALGVPSYGVASLFTKVSDSFAHGLNERAPTGTIAQALDQWYGVVKDLSR